MSYGFNNDKSKFPLGAASDLPDPTKTPMKIIGELQNQIIDSASIENGATASKAYASGDYICFQGALCKASKAISQGDTLSIGDSANDNLTLTDAAAEFARINSNLKEIGYTNCGSGSYASMFLVKYNKYLTALKVRLTLNSDTAIYIPAYSLSGVVAQLPDDAKPSSNIIVTVHGREVNTSEIPLSIYIYTSGEVRINNAANANYYIIDIETDFVFMS